MGNLVVGEMKIKQTHNVFPPKFLLIIRAVDCRVREFLNHCFTKLGFFEKLTKKIFESGRLK